MTFKAVELTLSADVATAGTFTVSYPTGTDEGAFAGGTEHYILALGAKFTAEQASGGISLSFGASNITVTYNGSTTIPAGSKVWVQLDQRGRSGESVSLGEDSVSSVLDVAGVNVTFGSLVEINLGSPDVADPNGVAESQGATTATLDGALVSGGVATFDVPRNVVAAWTTTATLTVTGTDVFGNAMVETSGSGTSMAGKKAFKTVTSAVFSTAVTGATIGTGDVLGLPVYLGSVGFVLEELEDDGIATGGTIVAGLAEGTPATATNADVRGTYDANSAADGAKSFSLITFVPDVTNTGVAQYTA